MLETVKKTEERLSKIQVQGPGTTVEMNSLVTHKLDSGDIWLKHPGNESSEDEEGTEEQHNAIGDDEMEESNFKSFIDKRT